MTFVTSFLNVTLATSLSSTLDTIDVNKMSNGGIVTALNAVAATTTSAEIALGAAGFKSFVLELTGSGMTSGYVVTLTGSAISGGTHGAVYTQKDDKTFAVAASITLATNVVVSYVFKDVCDNYIKIIGTKTDGTLTAKVIPFN